MKKFFIFLIFMSFAFANSIIIIDLKNTDLYSFKKFIQTKLKNEQNIILIFKIFNKKFNKYFIYQKRFKNINQINAYLYSQKANYKSFNTPYLLYLAYKINEIDPSYNKIYMINSVFYKDNSFNFMKGYPSDGFVNYENFKYLPKFKNNVNCYIFVDSSNFNNVSYVNKYRRFYYYWLKNKNINLVAFNTNYNLNKENFKYKPLNSIEKLKIKNLLPKAINIKDDEVKFEKNKFSNVVKIIIKNPVRKNQWASVLLNKQIFYIYCNEKGICKKNLKLNYGKNLIEFTTIKGKKVKKELKNICKNTSGNYKIINITNDKITFFNNKLQANSKVPYYINDEKKINYAIVNKNHQFEINLTPKIKNITLYKENCQLIKIDIPKNIKSQNLNLNFKQNTDYLLYQGNDVFQLKEGENTFTIPLKKASFIKEILLYEADADYDTINIGVITINNNFITLKKDIPASGDCGFSNTDIINNAKNCSYHMNSCCMIHDIKIPSYLHKIKIKGIFIKTKSSLNGRWFLKKLIIKKD